MGLGFRRSQSKTLRDGRSRGTVSLVRSAVVLQTAILAIAFSTPGSAASGGDLRAKIEYCEDCHGASGQGYYGFYPIPRLAGQHAEYLENQLRAFAGRGRPNNIMSNVARSLSPQMIAALAAHFSELNTNSLAGAPRKRVAAGKEIFENGVPDANVAACAACHGPDATGTGQFPRLAGQLYPYIVQQLANWGKEHPQKTAKPDASAIMAPVAHSLTKPQMEAVAAFLSNLK